LFFHFSFYILQGFQNLAGLFYLCFKVFTKFKNFKKYLFSFYYTYKVSKTLQDNNFGTLHKLLLIYYTYKVSKTLQVYFIYALKYLQSLKTLKNIFLVFIIPTRF